MADINVGDVAVDVVPDARSFARKLAAEINPAAKALGEKIGRNLTDDIADGIRRGLAEGFVGSDATAKRKGAKAGESFGGAFSKDAKARIKAALSSLPDAKIGVATSEADQKLKDLRVRLAALADKTIGIDIRDNEALAEMAALEAELAALGSQSPNVQVQVDTARASAQLAAFRLETEALTSGGAVPEIASEFAGIGGSLTKGVSGLAAMIPLAVVLATALIPVVASVAGLVGLLAAPLAAAGGGLTLFAILGGKAIANTLKTSKEIDKLRKSAATLTDPKAAKAAAAQADALEKSLSVSQRAFLKAKGALSTAFAGLLKGKTGEALFAPIVAGMRLLANILPKLSPVIKAVSDALVGMIDGLNKKVSGDGFSKFIQGFADLAGRSLTALFQIAGNLGQALGNVFGAFAPAGASFLDTLVNLSQKFQDFTEKASTKQGLRDFIEYVRTNGPVVAKTISDFVLGLIKWMHEMAPTGAAILRVVSAVLSALTKYGPVLAGGFAGVVAVIKHLGSAFSAVGRAFRGIYNAAIGPVFSFLLKGIAAVMRGFAAMLRGLSHVPGFGWAKSAADKMSAAATKADGLADSVRKIPSRAHISVTSNIPALISQANALNQALKGKKGPQTHYATGTSGGQTAYAGGTNYAKTGVALVGEQGPELVRFRGGEKVLPANKTATALASSGSADFGSAEQIERLISAVEQARSIQLNGRELAKAVAAINQGGRP